MSGDSPVNRLDTLPAELPQRTLGWEVVKAAVKYLRHPNGSRAGERWQWIDSQIRFLLHWYAVDEDGRWLYHHGARRLSKGSGKSPFAALLALAELCFPVRLKDFDDRVPGGCIGQPVAMPWVQIAATSEAQTINTMRMVRAFAPKRSRIVEEFGLDPGKTKYYKQPEGTLEVITSSATAAEGAEASQVIADETENWLPNNGGPVLFATLLDNLAKSGNRPLETANSWEPGRESVAESTYDAWIAQEEGLTRGKSKILYDARIAPPDTDMSDEDSLRRGLEYVYDDCWWVDRRVIMERIWSPNARPDDSARKYLNWPTASADAWTTPQDWARLADASVSLADGDEIALFFDGSKTRDASALIGCRMSDGYTFTLGVWEPGGGPRKDASVPVDEIDGAVRRAFDRYTVVGFFSDVKEWESFAKVSWRDDLAGTLLVWAVPGGKAPEPIAWDMRSHVREFAEAAEFCEAEIRDGAFRHDGNSALARHVANARRRVYKGLVSVGKESHDSPRKIDACVSMIGARMVRRLVLTSSGWEHRNVTSGGAVFF